MVSPGTPLQYPVSLFLLPSLYLPPNLYLPPSLYRPTIVSLHWVIYFSNTSPVSVKDHPRHSDSHLLAVSPQRRLGARRGSRDLSAVDSQDYRRHQKQKESTNLLILIIMKTSTLPLTLLASYAMGVIGTPIAAEQRSVNMTALCFDTPDQVSNIQKTVGLLSF